MVMPRKKFPHMLVYDDGQTRVLNIHKDDASALYDAFINGENHVKLDFCALKLTSINFIQELEVIEQKKEPKGENAPSMLITVDLREYPEEYHDSMREWLQNPEAYSMGGVDIG